MSGEAFGLNVNEDAAPQADTFDLDAWLDQGARATRTVPVCIDARLLLEREDLAQRIERELARAEKGDGGDRALDEEPVLAELERQWEDVQARVRAASRSFTVKALNGLELKATREAAAAAGVDVGSANSRGDVNRLSLWMIAAASVDPVLTVDQVERIYNAGGDAAIHELATAVQELMVAGRATVSAPFSRGSSPGSRRS